MEIALLVFCFIAGAAMGSFLNVCIDRLPEGKSIVTPPSHCDSCGRRLSAAEMIPILSYLFQRGRCRACGARIGLRQLSVEIICGALFAFIFWRYGISPQFAVTAFYTLLFITVAFIDIEHKLILNKIILPAVLITLVLLGAASVFPSANFFGNLIYFPKPVILSGLLGGAAGFAFFMAVYLVYPRGMGLGDVKLAGLIGLVTGFPMVLIAIFIGITSGGFISLILILLKIRGRKDEIPFGSFLASGTLITLYWGNGIISWYTSLWV